MKCKISQADFLKTLKTCEKSLLAKAGLPILSNVSMAVAGDKLEVLSTNLESATRATAACRTQTEGKTTLPGKVLLEFVAQLPEEEVTIENLGEEVLVSTKSYSARLSTMPPEEFPAIPRIEAGRQFIVDAPSFVRSVSRTAFCAAQDEGRPTLSGVLCEIGKGKLSMVATDGYRLSFTQTLVSGQAALVKVIVPARTIGEVAKTINEYAQEKKNKTLTIVVAENLSQINFKIDSVEFTSRLIEGEFPNWQKIIPTSFETRVKVAREDFIKIVRAASIFARESSSIVRLKLEAKIISVLATTSQVGSSDIQAAIELSGHGGEIAFNFRYLLEALAVAETQDVNFEMSESLTPARITEVSGDDKFFHIIMPVRLQA